MADICIADTRITRDQYVASQMYVWLCVFVCRGGGGSWCRSEEGVGLNISIIVYVTNLTVIPDLGSAKINFAAQIDNESTLHFRNPGWYEKCVKVKREKDAKCSPVAVMECMMQWRRAHSAVSGLSSENKAIPEKCG